jgi:GNAT superfamily N-acetyltransferase
VPDRLLRLLGEAATGSPPPADGLVEVWPPPPGAVEAVLAFTAHHVVAARALRYRDELAVWTDPDGLGVLVLGRGLAGRREVAFEVDPAARDRGLGRLLVAAARHLTPPGEPLFAQVRPGNAASLRVVGAAGFRPIGAEVLFHRDGADPS